MEISDDWINILFVVVAALAGLVSAHNKKKKDAEAATKRKANQETNKNFPEEKDLWETLQKELQGQSEQPVEPAPVKVKPVIVSKPPKKRTSQPFIPSDLEVKGASIPQTQTETEPILEEPVSEHSFVDFSDHEELKKAVIYSEILHPKYLD